MYEVIDISVNRVVKTFKTALAALRWVDDSDDPMRYIVQVKK